MTVPEQGRSGIWFRMIRRKSPSGEGSGWEVVGKLAGSKYENTFADGVYYTDVMKELRRLLNEENPKGNR